MRHHCMNSVAFMGFTAKQRSNQRVFLDGREVTNYCQWFDTTEGVAALLPHDQSGRILDDGKEPAKPELCPGRVCVIVGDASDLKIEPANDD